MLMMKSLERGMRYSVISTAVLLMIYPQHYAMIEVNYYYFDNDNL